MFTGILGHEFLGVIEEIEEGFSLAVGTRVVGEINLACQNCEICNAGGITKRNHCPNRTVLGNFNIFILFNIFCKNLYNI